MGLLVVPGVLDISCRACGYDTAAGGRANEFLDLGLHVFEAVGADSEGSVGQLLFGLGQTAVGDVVQDPSDGVLRIGLDERVADVLGAAPNNPERLPIDLLEGFADPAWSSPAGAIMLNVDEVVAKAGRRVGYFGPGADGPEQSRASRLRAQLRQQAHRTRCRSARKSIVDRTADRLAAFGTTYIQHSSTTIRVPTDSDLGEHRALAAAGLEVPCAAAYLSQPLRRGGRFRRCNSAGWGTPTMTTTLAIYTESLG